MSSLQHDTYFLNSAIAFYLATENFNAVCSGAETELLLCYCNNPPPPNAPVNLVFVPFNRFHDFFLQTSLPIPLEINTDGNGNNNVGSLVDSFNEIRKTTIEYRRDILKGSDQIDTYFFDRQIALLTALQQNRVKTSNPLITGLQVCYYHGEPIIDPPENLIHLPFEQFCRFFLLSRLRLPKKVYIPVDMDREESSILLLRFRDNIRHVNHTINEQTRILHQKIKNRIPPPINQADSLRIFLAASRLTTVMQYSSRNLAKSLEKLGHHVKLTIEGNEMEEILPYHIFSDYQEFDPNVTININYLNSHFLHEGVINVVWWQDPMPDLMDQKEIKYRKNDIYLAESEGIKSLVEQCTRQPVGHQRFCIDEEIFHKKNDTPRENSIVFIGSSYHSRSNIHSDTTRIAISELKDAFDREEILSSTLAEEYASNHHLDKVEFKLYPLSHALRDQSVRTLCKQKRVVFELYGYDWDYDDLFRAHYKGILTHGDEVANAYNKAKYALVCLPGQLFSQRLIEAAACGCIPVIYESSPKENHPQLNANCLFFHGRDSLLACLDREPPLCPTTIADGYTFRAFAARIVELVHNANPHP